MARHHQSALWLSVPGSLFAYRRQLVRDPLGVRSLAQAPQDVQCPLEGRTRRLGPALLTLEPPKVRQRGI
jgi:hypothetical protein